MSGSGGTPRWRDGKRFPREGQHVLIHVPALERAGGDDGVRAVSYLMGRFRATGGNLYWLTHEISVWYAYPRPPLRESGGKRHLRELTVPMRLALERLHEGGRTAPFTAEEVRPLASLQTLAALVYRKALVREGERYRLP